MSDLTGIVLDIHRAAFHDGPGIRTAVFLKGCPLRCAWCHNPESFALEPQTVLCDGDSRTYGRPMTVRRVINEALRDKPYYDASHGGITLSGGEPTVQFDFCLALLKDARHHGIHTCLDTSGYCPPERLRIIQPLVDLFLYDYKATGYDLHQALTGRPNVLILANLEMLYQAGARITLRCPLVPKVNDTQAHFEALADLSRRYPDLVGIEILPYHRAGLNKYALLGIPEPCMDAAVPDDQTLDHWPSAASQNGVFSRGGITKWRPITDWPPL